MPRRISCSRGDSCSSGDAGTPGAGAAGGAAASRYAATSLPVISSATTDSPRIARTIAATSASPSIVFSR